MIKYCHANMTVMPHLFIYTKLADNFVSDRGVLERVFIVAMVVYHRDGCRTCSCPHKKTALQCECHTNKCNDTFHDVPSPCPNNLKSTMSQIQCVINKCV